MVFRSWKSELRKGERERKEVKEDFKITEDERSELKQFFEDVNNLQKEIDTLPKSHTALIDSASLTNFLLWKLLNKRRI